jgi:hypothetical protein
VKVSYVQDSLPETLAIGKVVWSDSCTEVIGTTNTGADPEINSAQAEKEQHIRHSHWDE